MEERGNNRAECGVEIMNSSRLIGFTFIFNALGISYGPRLGKQQRTAQETETKGSEDIYGIKTRCNGPPASREQLG